MRPTGAIRTRTLIYLDPEDLQALRAEARAHGISLAELMRVLVRQHLGGRRRAGPSDPNAYLKIVGLGSSGHRNISQRHDAYLADALRREHSG